MTTLNPEQKFVNEKLLEILKARGIPFVAANDVHYISRQDAAVHDDLLCIQTGNTIKDSERIRFKTEEFYFKTAEEMADLLDEQKQLIITGRPGETATGMV